MARDRSSRIVPARWASIDFSFVDLTPTSRLGLLLAGPPGLTFAYGYLNAAAARLFHNVLRAPL